MTDAITAYLICFPILCSYSAHLREEFLSLLSMEELLIFLHTSDRYLVLNFVMAETLFLIRLSGLLTTLMLLHPVS